MNAKALLEGLYALYTGSAALQAKLPGGLHLNAAPAQTSFEYATYMLIGDVPERTFNTLMEDVRVQFNIFSEEEDVTKVTEAYQQLDTVYDDAALVVVGYDTIKIERGAVAHLDRDPEGAWMYVVEYNLWIQKQ